MCIDEKMNEEIHASMCRALELLGADSTLLSWACSRFDTQPDSTVLQGINAWIKDAELNGLELAENMAHG